MVGRQGWEAEKGKAAGGREADLAPTSEEAD